MYAKLTASMTPTALQTPWPREHSMTNATEGGRECRKQRRIAPTTCNNQKKADGVLRTLSFIRMSSLVKTLGSQLSHSPCNNSGRVRVEIHTTPVSTSAPWRSFACATLTAPTFTAALLTSLTAPYLLILAECRRAFKFRRE